MIDRRHFCALVFLIFVLFAPVLTGGVVLAQDDDVEELDELKEERDRIEREAALAAAQIDVVQASVEEVTKALDELAAFVDKHRARVEDAEQTHRKAVQAIEESEQRIDSIEIEMVAVRAHMSDLAVASFTGENAAVSDDITRLAFSDDPGESARFIHLLELQTGSLADGLDRMRALETEVELVVDAQRAAENEAADALAEVEARSAELVDALALQERVVTAAEIRLEAQLAEVAFLQERDLELATEISDQQVTINNRIAATARANGVEIPDPVRLEEIVQIEWFADGVLPEPEIDPETGLELPVLIPLDAEAFMWIEVHKDIELQTQALFDEAFADGIDLAGWGYRPIQRQIELRAAHCGGSENDIWHKPAFDCAPPTARPGFSKHEQGRAIDFTFNGASITSRDSAGFQWLAAHAPKYGFVNLESEPWHWSIADGEERLPSR